MCTNTFILALLFILKILVFLVPLIIYFAKKIGIIDKVINYFYLFEILSLILLIILCFFSKDCIKNSSITGIKLNSNLFDDVKFLNEDSIAIDYTNINPGKVYKNNADKDVNYYNVNLYPLKNIKLNCEKKTYFQNFGNDIAALSTALSTSTYQDINPYDILKYLMEIHKISCSTNINSDELISIMSNYYGVEVRTINFTELSKYISQGSIVLGKTRIGEENNLSCGENLIIIYYVNDKNEFKILNPSDRLSDYFCPSNTLAYGTVVKGKQNNITFTSVELSNYISDFYVLEVN